MFRTQQLKHALALYCHGNFRRAAEAVHISQPAFSRSIRALEEELDAVLFDRNTDGITPTLFGEVLLRRAQTIIEEAGELEREIGLLKDMETGTLAVAIGTYPAELSGSRAAGELIRRHPHLRCQFTLGDWRKVGDRVLARAVDLGFAEVSEAQTNDALVTEVVGQHRVVFYCRKGHPLASLSKVSKAELDRYPLVAIRIPDRVAASFPGGTSTEQSTGHLVPAIEVEDVATARAIVAGSDAVSGAALSQLEPALQTGEFVCLPFRVPVVRFNYGFIYRRDRMLSPAAELFMELVRHIEEDVAAKNCRLENELFQNEAAYSK